MHLQRVRVPDFRVLQDVDIEFEKEFFPKVFPLGSQNGGGKSTLLQLIFVLLHCSQDPERIVFLQNLLEGFQIPEGSSKRNLASFEIWDGEKTVLLEFFCCNDSYLAELLESSSEEDGSVKTSDMAELRFSAINEIEETKKDILNLESNLKSIAATTSEVTKKIDNIRQEILDSKSGDIVKVMRSTPEIFAKGIISDLESEQKQLNKTYKEYGNNLIKAKQKIEYLDGVINKTLRFLGQNEIIHICNNDSDTKNQYKFALLCCVKSMDIDKAEDFLLKLAAKMFLAVPANQVFLFIARETRKNLFRTGADNNGYNKQLDEANSKLPGLLAHNFLAVNDLLIEAFKAARDRDFIEMTETGKYGSEYPNLLKEFKSIGFYNIIINVTPDLSGVTFKIDKDGEVVELYPEDLSHGELKMLSIYTWLKHRKIENAIVLMDEIEMAFHPDWQYQIVRDLQDWAPSNQYILATHSYDLCEAVTPPHVKELEPKLLRSGAEE